MSDESAMRLLDLITAAWLASVGASMGSFINVVAYRLPLGASIVWIPSRCPACGSAIRLRDNIPLLGWLLLGGRCRDCGVRISSRYFLVEAAMAGAFFVLAYVELFSGGANLPNGPLTSYTGAWGTIWHPEWELIGVYFYHCAVLSVLMAMALIDLDRQRVPWSLLAFGFLPSLAAKYAMPLASVSCGAHLIASLRDRPILAATAGGAFGMVLGVLLLQLSRIRMLQREHKSVILWNSACAMAVLGAMLGTSNGNWAAFFALLLVALLVDVCWLAARPTVARGTSIPCVAWPATLAMLIWWSPLCEFFP